MTARYLQMLMLLPAGVFVSGCLGDDNVELTAATATILNQLPVDGCSYVVRINEVDYAPDAASRALIIARELPSVATVSIKYRVTGRTGQVDCGNATGHADLPEIALVFPERTLRASRMPL